MCLILLAFWLFGEMSHGAGGEKEKACATLLRSSLFTLHPPHKRNRVNGLVARTVKGEIVAGFNAYVSAGHLSLADMMKKQFGGIEIYLWGGEAEVSFVENKPVITIANETSSFLSKFVGPELVANRVSHFGLVLNGWLEELRADGFQMIQYDPAAEHLDSRLNAFRSFGGNFRHNLRNFLHIFNLRVRARVINFEKRMNRDSELSPSNALLLQQLITMVDVLRDQGIIDRKYDELEIVANRILERGVWEPGLTIPLWEAFVPLRVRVVNLVSGNDGNTVVSLGK